MLALQVLCKEDKSVLEEMFAFQNLYEVNKQSVVPRHTGQWICVA